jgi:hypothetical protein
MWENSWIGAMTVAAERVRAAERAQCCTGPQEATQLGRRDHAAVLWGKLTPLGHPQNKNVYPLTLCAAAIGTRHTASDMQAAATVSTPTWVACRRATLARSIMTRAALSVPNAPSCLRFVTMQRR